MGQANITEIEASLKDWMFLQELPKKINDFILQPGTGIDGQELNIVSYNNKETHCKVDLIYTAETFDYVPVKNVGLHRFRDDRFFCRDREKFSKLMLDNLPKIINDINKKTKHKFSYESQVQNFDKWKYWEELPQNIGRFKQFITPDNPLYYINGSILFLDYTDFETGDQLYFLYNTFRDELFAEMKKAYIPYTTDAFNAKNLDELTLLIEGHLKDTLENF